MVTVDDGFLVAESGVTEISFYINDLTNPTEAATTESFTIQTFTDAGTAIDYLNSGVTFSLDCDSACLTCEGTVTTCTSCDTTSALPYLSTTSTCVATCADGTYLDTDQTCTACDSSCATCETTSTRCLS